MKYIDKVAKEMTREEFLSMIGVNEHVREEECCPYCCPDQFGLEEGCPTDSCKTCWKNAVLNIKFKGER